MAAYLKFNVFTLDLINGIHDFDAHTFKIGLTNRQPLAADAVRATSTELSTGNGYTNNGAGLALTITTNQTAAAGTARAIPSSDITVTSATGTLGPFQWVF